MKLKKLGAALLAAVVLVSAVPGNVSAGSWSTQVESVSYDWNVNSNKWEKSGTWKSNYDKKGRYLGYEDNYRNWTEWDADKNEPVYVWETTKSVYKYDKKGRIASRTYYDSKGEITSVDKGFKFNGKNQITSFANYNGSNEKVYSAKYSYDGNGNYKQVKETWANGKTKTVEKYTNGRQSSRVSYNEAGEKTYETTYDKHGWATKDVSYSNGKVSYSSTYKNTYKGDVISKRECNQEDKLYGGKYQRFETYYTSGAKAGWEKEEKSVSISKDGTKYTTLYKYSYKTKNGHITERVVQTKGDQDKEYVNSHKSEYKYKTFKY